MRLINVSTLEFLEPLDSRSVKYAILSHTWQEGQEVSYHDWQRWLAKDRGWEDVEKKSGFEKIKNACNKTKEHGLDYIWIDTNCIDKSSSAELSEAINSMFVWYSGSSICFAYLSDVEAQDEVSSLEIRAQLERSRWFTRGWTLQELLAPAVVNFFSRTWKDIGTRTSLATTIEITTGVGAKYLHSKESVFSASVATRMSWAATRHTSRVEDMAYSLLGLFDINMPLLYGEGEKAFVRLQEEIIKVSTDHSIFAWEFDPERDWATSFTPHPGWVSFLAPSPVCFRRSRTVTRSQATGKIAGMEIYSMTNLGLSIQLPLLATVSPRLFFAVLQCHQSGDEYQLCVPLLKVHDTFIRRVWPSKPLPLCPSKYQPRPTPVHLARYERFGRRDDMWESPEFAKAATCLILMTFSMQNLEVEMAKTTPGASFQPDFGLVEIHSPDSDTNFDGIMLSLLQEDGNAKLTVLSGVEWSRLLSDTASLLPLCVLWDQGNGELGTSLLSSSYDRNVSRQLIEKLRNGQHGHRRPGDVVLYESDGKGFVMIMRLSGSRVELSPGLSLVPISIRRLITTAKK